MNGLTGIVDAQPPAGASTGGRNQRLSWPPGIEDNETFEMLRDAVCVRALLDASDCRSTGDDTQLLLAESIAVIAGNMWRTCMNSAADKFPASVSHAAGQLQALADVRYMSLQALIGASDETRSCQVDQIGWLDNIASEISTRLVTGLREISHAAVC